MRYAHVKYVKSLLTNIQEQLNVANFLRNLQISWENNPRICWIKNAKFSVDCFYMNTNIQGEFQICISVPLMNTYLLFPQILRFSCSIQYSSFSNKFCLCKFIEFYFFQHHTYFILFHLSH